MSIYKESMINKIEDDLAGRNRNWDELELIKSRYVWFADYSVPASSTKTLVYSGDERFAFLLILQGGVSQGYGAYILQGYGIGGVRYRIGTIHEGTQVSVTVGAEGSRSFIISNTAPDSDLSCYIVLFAGSMPSVI